MSYCFNPKCRKPFDSSVNIKEITYQNRCQSCESPLLLKPRKDGVKSYRGIQLIGQGGFGKVIEVEDESGKTKVLKLIRVNNLVGFDNEKINAFFEREVKILSQLNHSGIPKIEQDGYFLWPEKSRKPSMYCFVMEKIDGSNLDKWLSDENNWPIPEEQVIIWLEQLLKILEIIHRKNYIHRDIKPSNIMRRPNGQLVLIDFGAARELTETYYKKFQSESTVGTMVFSSHGYTPEEQRNGRAVPQSDFFALGRTFVHILTGKYPAEIPLNDAGNLDWQIYAPNVSKSFVDLINKLIETSVKNRPQNIRAIFSNIKKIRRDIRQNRMPVIFQKPQIIITPEQQEKSTNPQLSSDQKQNDIADEILNVAKEVGEEVVKREVITSIIDPNKQRNLDDIQKQIREVSLQKILVKITEKIKQGIFGAETSLSDSQPKRSENNKIYLYLTLFFILVLAIPILQQFSKDYAEKFPVSPDNKSSLNPEKTGSEKKLNTSIPSPRPSVMKSPQEYPSSDKNSDTPIPILYPSVMKSPQEYPSQGYLPHFSSIKAIIFSPNGKLIAIAYTNHQIDIRQTDTGELINTIKSNRVMGFSPDGQLVVTVSMDEEVELWDIKTGKLQLTIPNQQILRRSRLKQTR